MILGRNMVDWPTEIRHIGMTDEELAKEVRVKSVTVKRWKEGDTKPRGHHAVKLAELIEKHQ